MNQLSFLGGGDLGASPIRRQYLDIKGRYPDAILFFRMGDFYETFDDDARVTSSALDITLTARDMGKGEKVPLAGIPYHAVEGYVAKLIAAGHKVAICEQLGTTAVKGLVPREVVRVVTPGTLVEDSLLPARANNYLASVVTSSEAAGLAFVDISTSEFYATEIAGSGWDARLVAELERVNPAECLMPEGRELEVSHRPPSSCCITPRDEATFGSGLCERLLRDHFKVTNLDGFGLTGAPLAVRAAGSLLSYLRETQPGALTQLESLHVYSLDRYMKLDSAARRNLELLSNASTGGSEGSLLSVLDRTKTAMGGRLLRRWVGQPLLERAEIEARLDEVEQLSRSPLGRSEIGEILSSVGDLERLSSRAGQQTLIPRDCQGIARTLRAVPRLMKAIERWVPSMTAGYQGEVDACPEAAQAIESTLVDDPPSTLGQGVIRPGRSNELDELREITGDTHRWITKLERTERERTGVKSLKVGFNRVFGYYIEVTRPNLDSPTDEFARMKTGASTIGEMLEALGYQRKQSLSNAERYVTADLKEQELRLQNAEAEIEGLEKQIYSELLAELSGLALRIRRTGQALARLDAALSLAEVAVSNRYVRPVVDDSTLLRLRGMRHPVVERSMSVGEYVANDCDLSTDDAQIAVLTGPNMAGKSTYALAIALTVLMAQIGSFVPADEAHIGLVDRVFTRIGAQHDVTGGKSTFLVEMAETANVLNNATPRSLVVLDEIGRGTSTYDGMAIARAVIEYIHDEPRLGCKTIFATHYHELTELESLLPRVRNLRMDVLEEGDRVVFLHRVVPGGADRSYGIHVAQLAGVPKAVIRRARQILHLLESNGSEPSDTPAETRTVSATDLSELLEEIRSIDLATITPLQAMSRLDDIQSRLHGGR